VSGGKVVIFTKFNPTDVKIKELADRLMNDHLYLSDEFRSYEFIHKMLFNNLGNKNNIFYEIGEFGGLLGFVNIIPEYKATALLKLWDKELWGGTFVKELKEIIKHTMIKYNLKRLATDSQDPRMVKLAKIMGFRIEGRFKYGFCWNGEYHTLHKMRILREEIGGK